MAKIDKRTLLAGLGVAGLGAGLAATTPFGAALFPAALAQTPAPAPRRKPIPNRMAKTTRLFKAPGPYPNALAIAPEGLWIAGQHLTEGEGQIRRERELVVKLQRVGLDWHVPHRLRAGNICATVIPC